MVNRVIVEVLRVNALVHDHVLLVYLLYLLDLSGYLVLEVFVLGGQLSLLPEGSERVMAYHSLLRAERRSVLHLRDEGVRLVEVASARL